MVKIFFKNRSDFFHLPENIFENLNFTKTYKFNLKIKFLINKKLITIQFSSSLL